MIQWFGALLFVKAVTSTELLALSTHSYCPVVWFKEAFQTESGLSDGHEQLPPNNKNQQFKKRKFMEK